MTRPLLSTIPAATVNPSIGTALNCSYKQSNAWDSTAANRHLIQEQKVARQKDYWTFGHWVCLVWLSAAGTLALGVLDALAGTLCTGRV